MSTASLQVLSSSCPHKGEAGLCWQTIWSNDVHCSYCAVYPGHGYYNSKKKSAPYMVVMVFNRRRREI